MEPSSRTLKYIHAHHKPETAFMPFTAALVQMLVKGGAKQHNVERAVDLIEESAAHGADLAVLPEALNLGWTHPSARTEADSIPAGFSFQHLAAAARRTGIYVCAGLVEKDGTRIYNSAVLIDHGGNLRLLHRKINELDIARDLYQIGDRLNVCETDLGRIGLHICADGFAEGQTLSRALGYMNADIILSPGTWAVAADHDNDEDPYGQIWRENYIPVARDFSLWIAGVSNVGWLSAGPWKGKKCIGCSLVIDPTGREVVCGPYGPGAETIIYLDIF
jgi:predicted amidohydrolase